MSTSLFLGQRLGRKRGPPEVIHTAHQTKQYSEYPPKWLIPPHASKKPKQPPNVAFGTRVETRATSQIVGQKSRMQVGSPKRNAQNYFNVEISSIKKPKTSAEVTKQNNFIKAESSAGDTDDVLVDGLVEVLMKATRFSEVNEDTENVSFTAQNDRQAQSMRKEKKGSQGASRILDPVSHATSTCHMRCVALYSLLFISDQ